MSLGGSSSKSRSKSETSKDAFNINVSQSGSFLDANQAANQQALVDQFMPALDTSAIQAGMDQAGQLIDKSTIPGVATAARDFRQGLQGDFGAFRDQLAGQLPFLGQLQNQQQAAMGNLGQFAQQNNPYLNSQIQQFGADIGRNLRENILPGLGSNAQMAGQRGGSRQGIAEGLAAQGAQRQFAQGATNMRSQAYGQQQQAAQALAGLSNQTMGQFAGLQQAGQAQLAGMGLQGAQQLSALQQAGYGQALNAMPQIANAQLQAQLQPFQIGASVVGAPSVLSQSSSFGLGMETARSTSTGSSSSAGLSMGL